MAGSLPLHYSHKLLWKCLAYKLHTPALIHLFRDCEQRQKYSAVMLTAYYCKDMCIKEFKKGEMHTHNLTQRPFYSHVVRK